MVNNLIVAHCQYLRLIEWAEKEARHGGSVMKTIALVAIPTAFMATSANAQSQCDQYVDQIIAPKTFAQAVAALNIPTPKGEFETTAAYQARVAGSGETGPLIVSKQPEDRKYLEYDADRQLFAVKSYFFHNTNFPVWETFYHAKNGVEAGITYNNIDVVISETETVTGTYESQNSYGAKATVTKITRTYEAIFDRKANYKETLFPSSDVTVGYFPMEISQAQSFKSQVRIAFVVSPKSPYVTRAEFSYGTTTVRNPTDVKVNATVLNADIQCALLMDASNKVLAAFATR